MPDLLLLTAAVLAGVLLLYFGAEWVVDEAIAVAEKHGIPDAIIGATLVALATSLPEWMVSVTASLNHHPGIALGNVAGSNLVNLGLMLALVFWFRPRVLQQSCARWDIPFAFVSMLLLAAGATILGGVNLPLAGLLLLMLIPYLYGQIVRAKKDDNRGNPERHWRAWRLAIGLVLVVAGSRCLVFGAAGLAQLAGIPEWLIAVTLVAIGTSLPELATTMSALRRQNANLGAGNMIGSNIWNTLFITGSAGVITPLPADTGSLTDLWAGTLMAAGLMFFFFRPKTQANRVAAMGLAAVYLGVVARWIFAST